MTDPNHPPAGAVKLEPCPFCGGEAERVDIDEGENAGGSCICCTRCLASGNIEFGFKENFVSNWNRRASPHPARRCGGLVEREYVERLAAEHEAQGSPRSRMDWTSHCRTAATLRALSARVAGMEGDRYEAYNTARDKEESADYWHEESRIQYHRAEAAEASLARLDQYLSALDDGPQPTAVIDEVCGIVHGRQDIGRAMKGKP